MNDLITIIVPIYNRFSLANRAINSVFNQSYQNWQLIIIDDCSSITFTLNDEILNIKQDVILIRNEYNLGPGLSRQRGLDIAMGDFVSFLDSDDFWHRDFLKESLSVHLQNASICATYCQSEMTNGELRRRNKLEDAVDNIFYGVVSGVRPWATCSILWRRKYLSNWSKLRTNQDALFELQTSLNNAKIEFIPKVLCIIDKGTGENANDLVGRKIGNINRTLVLLKSIDLIKKYKLENRKIIKKEIYLTLFVQLRKMLKIRNYRLSFILFYFILINLNWVLNSNNKKF